MTVYPIEHANQVAECWASRDVIASSVNADRLARWKARYPYNAVEVPVTRDPPTWPAIRCSIAPEATVTKLKARAAR